MKILINGHRKLFAIQNAFSEMFPYLKLEFFSKPNKVGGTPSKKIIKYGGKTIGQCRSIHNKGTLTITSEMTVADLENGFSDVYGLSVQVLRKSGEEWFGTTSTVGLTLKSQNNQGKELSVYYEEKYVGEKEMAE